jgi:F-type H+-transporting ATPase subunit delta
MTKRKIQRAARQLRRVCLVDGALDTDRVRQVAQRLAVSKRRGALQILAAFQRLVRLDCDRRRAVVESAAPLASDVRATVQARLSSLYGTGLEASFTENPGLIGGMRIKVGSDVYDGSVRAKLAALEARL